MVRAKDLLEYLHKNSICTIDDNNSIIIDSKKIQIDIEKNIFKIENHNKSDHNRIFDLTKLENHSVIMLLIELFNKGYSPESIYLEKSWRLGRNTEIYLDVMVTNPANGNIMMFEVKTYDEFVRNYSNTLNKNKMTQLISYMMQQQQDTKIASYYAFDFKGNQAHYNNIYCGDLLPNVSDQEDFYEKWNKIFNHDNFIKQNPLWGITPKVKKYNDLLNIQAVDTKNLYSQFLKILRLNSISDKPNAFMKVINLFLCKVADEIRQDVNYEISDKIGQIHKINGLMFQFIDGIDTPESFMKRLNDLYKDGMEKYLGKNIIEYSDSDIDKALNFNNATAIKSIIDNLRLKREHNFAFIEVYDDDTFLENFEVVKEIVKLLETYRFKYEEKQTFLGDFFEDLLNTSLKQEAGQFFTPYPLVDFMVKSLNFKNFIDKKILNNDDDFVPSVIDYACGAGHFLISAMSEIQTIMDSKKDDELKTTTQKKKLNSYKELQYSFVQKDKFVGVEKDYRLAKTTKIATFLNGDGDATILSADGINKFSSRDYYNTILYSNNSSSIEKFDYVISNPPYSVEGFMQSFRKNDINKDSNTFTLLDEELNDKNSDIETYFVERTWQLLKNGGHAAIILPQSVLSQNKYEKVRRFILDKFTIKSMLLTADITFKGTTTSPVILFLEKTAPLNLNYEILILMSPKYINPTGSRLKRKEESFLGYSFSSNRNKSGITIYERSVIKDDLISITKDFITNGKQKKHENVRIAKISDIIVNNNDKYKGDIYPKYKSITGKSLDVFCKINHHKDTDMDTIPCGYIEIGDLKSQNPSKIKNTKRYCKKGDILISSLTPTKENIVIAKNDFMLSTAIFVLSDFISEDMRDKIFEQLRSENVLEQMNAMLDGFKITYAKISEENLYHNVKINL